MSNATNNKNFLSEDNFYSFPLIGVNLSEAKAGRAFIENSRYVQNIPPKDTFRIFWWTYGELNPDLIHAMDA